MTERARTAPELQDAVRAAVAATRRSGIAPATLIALVREEFTPRAVPAPLAEFGGWGIRWGAGRRMGIVLRAGDALEVRRRDGRSLVVTVDDAATAAAVLAAASRVD